MNILIIGAGSVGLVLGSTLLEGGCRVSFLARGGTLAAIRADGVHRRGLFGPLDFPPEAVERATDDYAALPEGHFDFAVISAKTMANAEIAASLWEHRALFAPSGRILIVQNGWNNDEAYLKYFPREMISCARIITGCQRTAPNVSTVTVHTAPLLLGNLYGLDPAPMAPLAEAFCAGGFPCEVTDEVGKALLAKLLYNCTLNPLGAVLGVHYGALTECEETVAIMNDLIDEIFAVFDAAGLKTWWDTPEEYRAEFYGKLVPDTYGHHSSTLQDIQAGRKTEIDTLTGTILAMGARYSVPVPANTMLYRLVRAMEARR